MQLTAANQVATPAQWRPGDDVIIAGSVSDEEARRLYPQGWAGPPPVPADRVQRAAFDAMKVR
jgi:thioredoxin-dependent peroxiredoxin